MFSNTTSLDDRIISQVIVGRVLMDLNVINGIEEEISLEGLYPEYDPYYNAIFRIPTDRTNGRMIINCLGIGPTAFGDLGTHAGAYPSLPYGSANYGNTGCCAPQATTLNSELGRIYNSYKGGYTDVNVNTRVIGPNTILVAGFRYFAGTNLIARVTLENDSNLNNLHNRAIPKIAKFAELACKAHIYNTLIIPINQGMLDGGQDLSVFSNIAENYSSANEDYENYRQEVIGKVMFSNDARRMGRFINSILNNN